MTDSPSQDLELTRLSPVRKLLASGRRQAPVGQELEAFLCDIDRKRSWFQGSIELNYCVARSITLDVHFFLSL